MPLISKRIVLALLVAAFACGSVALPATAKKGKAGACKKAKKGKKGKKKKKGCRGGSGGGGKDSTLPGQQAHPTATPGAGSGGSNGGGTTTTQLSPTAVTLSDNPVLGGTSTQGEVTISGAAPGGGQAVSLASSDPTRASIPSSVVVAAGQTTANFPVNTTTGPATTELITASVGSSLANTSISIVQFPSVVAVTLDHQCYPNTGLVNYGVNTISLDVPTPINLPVLLGSDNPTALLVPPLVTVPAGSKTGVFGVTTLLPTPSATVTASVNGSSAQDTASVRDSGSPAPAVAGITVDPNNVTAGASSTGTVTLDCEALAGGRTVSLSSDNPDAQVPASVTVPQDSLSASFTITTDPSAQEGVAHISASPGTAPPATLNINDLGT